MHRHVGACLPTQKLSQLSWCSKSCFACMNVQGHEVSMRFDVKESEPSEGVIKYEITIGNGKATVRARVRGEYLFYHIDMRTSIALMGLGHSPGTSKSAQASIGIF